MESPGADAVRLSPHDEEEWERLRAQFAFAEGYWLGFLFSPSSYEARVVRGRVVREVEEKGGTLEVFTPDSPEALRNVLPWLLSPERKEAACVWVEGFFVDLTGKEAAPWIAAWDEVMLRANERREALRRHLKGGLVFAGPVRLKPRIREAAPDVWSSRAIVVEMAGGVYPRHAMMEMVPPMVQPPWERDEGEAAPDPAFWEAEAERRAPGTADRANALVEAARGLRLAGRFDAALVRMSEAVEIYRALSQTGLDVMLAGLAECLFNKGLTHGSLGQLDEALRSVREAVDIYRSLAEKHPDTFSSALASYRIWAAILEFDRRFKAGEVQEALELAWQLRDLAESLGDTHPGAAYQRPLVRYILGRALNRAERAEEALGALTEARQRFAELAAAGNATAALLEIDAIHEQGLALLALREDEKASAAYEQVIQRSGARGDVGAVAAAHVQLGLVRLLQGRFDDAEHAVQRALELARSLGDAAEVTRSQELLAEISRMRRDSSST